MKKNLQKIMLKIFPLPVEKELGSKGLVTLLGHRDVTRYLFSIRSFFYYADRQFPLHLLSDGSLKENDITWLKSYLPIKVLTNSSEKIKKKLVGYPWLYKYRFDKETTVFKLKLDLILTSPFQRFIIFDSDMIFLDTPSHVLSWLDSRRKSLLLPNYTEKQKKEMICSEYFSMFPFRKLLYKHLNYDLDAYTSSHLLGVFEKGKFNLNRVNNIIKILYQVDYAKKRHVDEIIFSVGFDNIKKEFLDGDKYFNMVIDKNMKEINRDEKIMFHLPGDKKRFFWKILFLNRLRELIKWNHLFLKI